MLRLKVTGMTCDHCVRAVTQAVRAVPGAGKVSVDLASGALTVHGSPDVSALRAAVEAEGYGLSEQAAQNVS